MEGISDVCVSGKRHEAGKTSNVVGHMWGNSVGCRRVLSRAWQGNPIIPWNSFQSLSPLTHSHTHTHTHTLTHAHTRTLEGTKICIHKALNKHNHTHTHTHKCLTFPSTHNRGRVNHMLHIRWKEKPRKKDQIEAAGWRMGASASLHVWGHPCGHVVQPSRAGELCDEIYLCGWTRTGREQGFPHPVSGMPLC